MKFNIEMTLIDCWNCKAYFGITEEAEKRLRKSHDGFYCPHCDKRQVYPSKTQEEKRLEKLEKDNEYLGQRNRGLNCSLESTRNSLRSTKGVVTKLKRKLEAE